MPARVPPIPNYEAIGLREHRHAPVWEAINKGWQPGKPGKGIMINGELYSWNTDGTFPNHSAAMDVIQNKDPDDYLFIEPDGSFRHENPRHDYNAEDKITLQDPRLKLIGPDTTWGMFGKVADFWDDQKKEDFPEDFELDEDGLLPWVDNHYTPEQVHQIVNKGVEPFGEAKAIATPTGNHRIEWMVDKGGGPHHDEVAKACGYGGRNDLQYLIRNHDGNWVDAYHMTDTDNDWNFMASVDENNHRLDWDEGNDGKGLLLADGSVHTWNGDDYDVHSDYLADHPELDAGGAHYLYIEPQGKCSTAWGTLESEHEDQLREADPRLYADIDQGGAANWAFGV